MNPAKFIRQVRKEAQIVEWFSKKETALTTVMIFVLVIIFSIFFSLVDWLSFSFIQFLLRLGVS